MDALSYALAMEEISAACASCGVIMSVNNSLFCDPVYKFGTDEQKKRVLAPVARGEKLGCFGLTEPMSGSDAQTMVDERGEDQRRLGPQRREELDHQRPARRLDPRLRGDRPLAAPRSSTRPSSSSAARRATRRTRADHKLGIHAAHSCTVFFENCKVPDANVVGDVGDGFKVAMATLDGGRIGIACQAHRHRAGGVRARASPTPRSERASACRSRSTRPSSSCWPTWRRRSTRRGSSPGARPR